MSVPGTISKMERIEKMSYMQEQWIEALQEENRHLKNELMKIKEERNESIKSLGGFTITVDKTELDEALDKANELVGVLQKIDGLTGRITRDIDKINRYALGKKI